MLEYGHVNLNGGVYTCRLTPYREGRVEIEGKKFRVDWTRPFDSIDGDLMSHLTNEAIITGKEFLERNGELPNVVTASALSDRMLRITYSRAEIIPNLNPKRDRHLSSEGVCLLMMVLDGRGIRIDGRDYSLNWIRPSKSEDGDLGGKMINEGVKCVGEFKSQRGFFPSSVYCNSLESMGLVYSRAI